MDGADHLPPPSGSLCFSTDSKALLDTRTPGQALYLAFGGAANATSGSFFPNGVNGSLNTSSGMPATTNGASLTASPNPIRRTGSNTTGVTTIGWNASGAQFIQIRVGSPTGTLFTYDGYQRIDANRQLGNQRHDLLSHHVTNGANTVVQGTRLRNRWPRTISESLPDRRSNLI
jgi:hypothetical protein